MVPKRLALLGTAPDACRLEGPDAVVPTGLTMLCRAPDPCLLAGVDPVVPKTLLGATPEKATP